MRIIKSKLVTWIDIMGPTEKDIVFLKENFHFHPFILKSIIPFIRHPRFENYKDYLFIVLHYPFLSKNKVIETRELDLLITKNTIITTHYDIIIPLRFLLGQLSLYEEKKEEFTDEGTGELLYRILDEFLKSIYPQLDYIVEGIERVQKEIFNGKQKEVISEISFLKENLINFQKIIRPQYIPFEGLKKEIGKFLGVSYTPYFVELYNSFLNIREIIQTHHQILNELEETNSNLLSTKTNEIIKILTIFTVILTPIALLANIFGMNITFPFNEKLVNFWAIIVMMTISLLAMIIYIKRKKWL